MFYNSPRYSLFGASYRYKSAFKSCIFTPKFQHLFDIDIELLIVMCVILNAYNIRRSTSGLIKW